MAENAPPPPYNPAEYGKPPPYFTGPPTNTSAAEAPPTSFPQPPPPATHVTQQPTGSRPTVITVTSTPAYVVAQPQPRQQTVQVLQLGNCPACRIGFLRREFDICGIILAILFFPFGVICCLCMMENRCSHCGARF